MFTLSHNTTMMVDTILTNKWHPCQLRNKKLHKVMDKCNKNFSLSCRRNSPRCTQDATRP